MSQYVDTSALLKRYIDEDDSDRAAVLLEADTSWITGRHTWVEVIRNLSRLLDGPELVRIEAAFRRDWQGIHVVEVDRMACERAAEIARAEGVRTLDALHLAAAQRVGATMPFVTFDARQARAARALGFVVSGC